MNADSKSLRAAANQKSAPQYFDATADQYEYLQGRDGGSFVHVLTYDALTDVNMSVGGQAVGFDAVPSTAERAFITVETAVMRYRVTGAAPTTALGHLVEPGDVIVLDSRRQVLDFRAIGTGEQPTTLQVTFFGGVL